MLMGSRVRALLGTLVVVAVPAITIQMLHGVADRPWFQIDYGDFLGWLGRTSLTDALTALARLAALVLAYYLLLSTVLYLLALASGSRSLVRITRPLALPVVRSLADRVVAGSIAISALATPLIASAPPAPEAVARPGVSAGVAADYLPESRLIEDVEIVQPPPPILDDGTAFTGRPTTPPPETLELAADTPTGPIEVVVQQGDHLWGLAETRIGETMGREPMDHEVAPYWREVVELNRDRIRSGNPDLIVPGEVVVLPDPAPFIGTR